MGELPRPASFEKIPRLIPAETAFETTNPATPPATGAGSKAPVKISAKAGMIFSLCVKITARDTIVYAAVISGRSACAAEPMRPAPPYITRYIRTKAAPPTMYGLT